MTLKKIDEAAELWEKTKDPKYKALWYQYIKEWADGTNNSERRFVSTSSSIQADDGRNSVDKQRRLFWFVWDIETKINRICKWIKFTYYERWQWRLDWMYMWPVNKKMKNKILSLHAAWLFENGYYDESIDCLNQATDLKRTGVQIMPRAIPCTSSCDLKG